MSKAESILKRPYRRCLIPDTEVGGFTAVISEFPGCITEGATREEALEALEEVAIDWIECELEDGRSIPEPEIEQDYSGRLLLRLPKSLHGRLAQMAERESTSLNQLIVSTLSAYDGAQRATVKINEQIVQISTSILATLQSSIRKTGDQFAYQKGGNLLPFRQSALASGAEKKVRVTA